MVGIWDLGMPIEHSGLMGVLTLSYASSHVRRVDRWMVIDLSDKRTGEDLVMKYVRGCAGVLSEATNDTKSFLKLTRAVAMGE